MQTKTNTSMKVSKQQSIDLVEKPDLSTMKLSSIKKFDIV